MNLALHQVIIRPHFTEKATSFEGMFAFLVHKEADKPMIKKAVEQLFSVKVQFVNTLTYKPLARFFGRKRGVEKGYKVAYVRLSEGTIDFNSL